jgi:peptidoglycan/LPS O-acetylase OafA/YrhL
MRLHQLDSLRGLAALMVLFHHVCFSCWPYPEAAISPAFSPWISWLKYGHFPVTFFIVLSGFVISLPLARDALERGAPPRPRWRKFFFRRVKRILPTYYAALACSVAVAVMLRGRGALRPSDLIGHLLLIHDWGVGWNLAFNSALWSIPVEWHIYFTVPLLFLCWRKFGIAMTTVAWVFAGYAFLWLLAEPSIASPHYYGLFAIGGAAALAMSAGGGRLRTHVIGRGAPVIASGAVWALMTFIPSWSWYLRNYQWCDLSFAVFAALFIAWIAECPSALRRRLEARVWVQLGTMSYSLYLVHTPLLACFDAKFNAMPGIDAGRKFFLLSLFACPVILALTYVFHRMFERPFLASRAGGAT